MLRLTEIPAIITFIESDPEIYGVFKGLYQESAPLMPAPPTNDLTRRLNGGRGKNCAFSAMIQRKPDGNGGLDTLDAAEIDTLINRAIRYMEYMNTTVEPYGTSGGAEWLWRSNELQNHLQTYDLLKGLGVHDSLLATSRGLLVDYTANLYSEASWVLLGLGFFEIRINNHGLRTAGTLAMAAIILNDESSSDPNRQPTNWMNIGLYNINNILFADSKRQSSASTMAGYAEGPHYLKFGMKHVLPMMHAMGQFIPVDTVWPVTFNNSTKNIRNPWYDTRMDRLWEWCARIRYPDGRFPSLEDCFVDISFADLALLEKPEYVWFPDFTYRKHPESFNLGNTLKESSDDLRADFLCAQTTAGADTFELFQRLPISGNLIFRTGWDSSAACMHVTCKNGLPRLNAQGHNQADASSFQIQYAGRDLALDLGYLKWDRRFEVGQARHHNMILIDTAGPQTGTPSNANGANAFLENDIDLNGIDYAEVRTKYKNTDIVRKYAMIGNEYFIVADEVTPDTMRDLQWRFHGNGLIGGDSVLGTCWVDSTNSGHYIWYKLGASIDLNVGGTSNEIYRTELLNHEWVWDSTRQHTAVEVELTGDHEHYLAVMYPFMTDTPSVTRVSHPAVVAYRVDRDSLQEFLVAGADTVTTFISSQSSGLGKFVRTNSQFLALGFRGDTVPDFWLTENNDHLEYGGALWTSTYFVDFALEKDDAKNYSGYCSDSTDVVLHFPAFAPGSVLGAGVDSWSYNALTQELMIDFKGGGKFTIHEDVIISEEPRVEESEVLVWPNPVGEMLNVRMKEAGEYLLFDLNGRIQMRGEVEAGENQLALEGKAKGVFLLAIRTQSQFHSKKIIVK